MTEGQNFARSVFFGTLLREQGREQVGDHQLNWVPIVCEFKSSITVDMMNATLFISMAVITLDV